MTVGPHQKMLRKNYSICQIWIKIEQKLGLYLSKLGNIKFLWIATCNEMNPWGGDVGFAITEKFTCRFCNFPAFVVFLLLEREGTHLSWRCQLSNQSENEAISWKFFFWWKFRRSRPESSNSSPNFSSSFSRTTMNLSREDIQNQTHFKIVFFKFE